MSRSAADFYYAAHTPTQYNYPLMTSGDSVGGTAAHSWAALTSTAAETGIHPAVRAERYSAAAHDPGCSSAISSTARLQHAHATHPLHHRAGSKLLGMGMDMEPPNDPFAGHCRIPLPHPFGDFHFNCESSFIRKRNERERERVRCVNEGYDRLKEHLPLEHKEKRISKVEILKTAIKYINYLQQTLQECDEDNKTTTTGGGKSTSTSTSSQETRRTSSSSNNNAPLSLTKKHERKRQHPVDTSVEASSSGETQRKRMATTGGSNGH